MGDFAIDFGALGRFGVHFDMALTTLGPTGIDLGILDSFSIDSWMDAWMDGSSPPASINHWIEESINH